MVTASARVVPLEEVEHLRAMHRGEAACQIVRDSILPRGLAEAYALEVADEVVGYAGVWTDHFPGRLMEFYLVPEARTYMEACAGALLRSSGAVEIEAQTNIPLLHRVLRRFAVEIRVENLLFQEAATEGAGQGDPSPPDTRFRLRQPGDGGPPGEWVLVREADGMVVGAGGFLRHYNPPWCDLYMEVAPDERRRGYGTYLVQRLRGEARAAGLEPAARCNADNEVSRRTLLKGGMVECGRIEAGRVDPRNVNR